MANFETSARVRSMKFFCDCFFYAAIVYVAAGILRFTLAFRWQDLFHDIGYYLPAVCTIGVLSLQMDVCASVCEGRDLSIKARGLDLVHWLLLTFIAVGGWMQGGATPVWFVVQLLILAVIGWTIGIGIKQQWQPSIGERRLGALLLTGAVVLGSVCGAVRAADSSPRGWGWGLETATAIIATLIVLLFIAADVKTMRRSVRIGYPRSMFLKGMLCNAFVVWYWAHIIVQRGGFNTRTLVDEAGLTFNVVVGNCIYFFYYLAFEYYKAGERKRIVLESLMQYSLRQRG